MHFPLCTKALGFEDGFSSIGATRMSTHERKYLCKTGQRAPAPIRSQPGLLGLCRRLTAASPGAGRGPLSPPRQGPGPQASGSSASSSSAGGAAALSPPCWTVAQSLQTELEGRLRLMSEATMGTHADSLSASAHPPF